MSGEYQPQAPATQAGPTVMNPALGNLGTPVQLPQQSAPVQPQPVAPQQPQPWQMMPNQQANPYGQGAQQPLPNPYTPPLQQNPYGQPQQQQSPFAAPPQGINQYLPNGQVPEGQAMPWQPQQQQPQQQPNPAFQFNPYGQQPAQQQPPGQNLAQQFAQLQNPQQQQPQQPSMVDQLAKQQGGMTQEQVAEIFPDAQSRAIFQGMDQIGKGTGIDLLAAFGSAYERRDPTLVNDRYLAQFDQQTVNILKGQFSALVQAGQQRDAQLEQSVYQMAGGRDRWDLAVKAFNTTADERTIKAVAAAVNSGDPNQVHLAVQNILRYATQSGSMVQRDGQLITPGGGGQPQQDVMTNEKFKQHLTLLEQAHPVGSPQYNQFYQQLVAQRRQAKAQGF